MSYLHEKSIEDDNSVSVVIAAYNRPDYLRLAIESIVNQTIRVHEIIVVDDCSELDLKIIIDEFNNQNIIYLKKEANKGVSDSRNVGIKKASGKWISFLDDDDLYLPNKIESNLNDIRSNKCAAVLCGYEILETGERSDKIKDQIITKKDLIKGNPFCGTSGLFAKKEYLENEMFDTQLPLGEDWDLFIRLTNYGIVKYNADPLYLYRKGHDSITSNAKKQTISDAKKYTLSSVKHKAWLGGANYRRRVARVYLSYIWVKKNKISWLSISVKEAGIVATIQELIKMGYNFTTRKI
ncbi:MAG: glycosyltransferase [Pseudoalteromonas distincta]|uniref:glycosyltransferase family 2 protein n=1 Tax=Pseudoalteromonas distincta TaxID=77608 RepID=UPI0003FCC19C|nr:glycosyltransferase [Pseudoalteromonas sp. TB13]